jgi:dihydrofolate synthase/folylpolyglutamate synthase
VAQAPLDWLLGLGQFGIKFGLDNMRAIVGALGHPERAFRAIHVGGTNGKGSVTAMIEAALRLRGLRTGRYTSPHLLHLAERFAIDGAPTAIPALEAAVERVRSAVVDLQARRVLDVHPTFFEVTTAAAFELFRGSGIDVAVCEVGLGGRLDATNVLEPAVCAITSIGLDHQQYLGHTLAEIAREKAGIIKPGTPVVVGAMDRSAADAIGEQARTMGAPLVWAHEGVTAGRVEMDARGGQRFHLTTPTRSYGDVYLALAGEHQVGNAVVAVRTLEQAEARGIPVGADAIVAALAQVQWPGRLQRIDLGDGRDVILDAAHNDAGAAALAAYLAQIGPPRPLVFAAMRDKDAASMLRALLPVVGALVVTRASNPRSADPETLAGLATHLDRNRRIVVERAVADALTRAWHESPHIVVAGSIFLLADVMNALGRS